MRFEEHAGCALLPLLLKVVRSCSLLSEHFVTLAHETSSCRCGVASDELPSGRIGFPLANSAAGCREKFVDLTHDFAPGIPHWAGFPEETRKTIYWYDKRADTVGAGFCAEVFTHVANGGRTSIHRRI